MVGLSDKVFSRWYLYVIIDSQPELEPVVLAKVRGLTVFLTVIYLQIMLLVEVSENSSFLY